MFKNTINIIIIIIMQNWLDQNFDSFCAQCIKRPQSDSKNYNSWIKKSKSVCGNDKTAIALGTYKNQ